VVTTALTHNPTAHHDHATPTTLAELKPAQPSVIYLRDGEVVLYRRAGSAYWQVRYKLRTGAWVRESTAQAALENAIPTACELYDEARFRQKLGLAHKGATFTELAQAALQHLRLELDAGRRHLKNENQRVVPIKMTTISAENIQESKTHQSSNLDIYSYF
jgi:hypothetical protein